MLQALVHWSLRNRVAVLTLAVVLLAVGVYASYRAKLDVFPEFTPPQVVIQTEAPGLSAAEVEQLVTTPIEQAINGMPRLDVLRSQSIQGLSVLTAVFQDGADVYRARQQVAERLAELAGQFPAGVRAPRLAPLTSATGRLLTVGFTSDKLSPLELRDRVQWLIRPRVLAVAGVAQVTLYGGGVRQFQVQVDLEQLAAHGLTLTDAIEATRQASGVRGGGFLEGDSQRLTLRVEAQARSAAELGAAVIVAAEGTPVRLRDVAHVVEGPEPKFGDAAVEGKPAVVLIAYRQPEGDTPEITRKVEAELERLRPGLERDGIEVHPALFRQANFIEHAVGNVTHSLLIGAALVTAVLLLFLFNLRIALISLTAIPLSLLAAVVVLWAFGVSLNTLTLGGLAIAVGEVVDDAIIDVENIARRLRANARLEQPRSALAVVLDASLEVRSAVVYATFVVVLVFVPVFFLSGLQGRLFAPLGYAYVLAVLASLGVALTVTPALSLLLLPQPPKIRNPKSEIRKEEPRRWFGFRIWDFLLQEEPPLLRWLQGGYERVLRLLDREFPLIAMGTLSLVAAAAWAAMGFGGDFLPELRENHLVLHMRGTPGTSLRQSLETGQLVTRKLHEHAGVVSVCQQVGRAELGEDTWGVEYSELEVDLRAAGGASAEDAEKYVKRVARGEEIAGFSFEALPFLSERIKETLSGSTGAVVVKVFGDNLEALDDAAQDIARVLRTVKGNVNVRTEAQTGTPEVVIRLRREDAARLGLRATHVLDAVHAAFQGAEVGQVYDRNRVVSLVVLLAPAARADPTQIADLRVPIADSPDKSPISNLRSTIRLGQVADVFLSDGRFLIGHEGGLRRQVVTCNVEGRDVESFVTESVRKVRQLTLAAGIRYSFSGEHEARRTAQRELLLLSLAAGAGILLLLWAAFGAVRPLLLVVVNLPFALVGGVAAVYLSGGVLNVGSLIGFVTLFGITTRNGIMMVSHWQHLHEVEGLAWGPELVFRGARERLGPVLMTALVTGLGLLPIALGSGAAGREIEGPMALVILGGLVTSTVLNLVVLPLLYRRFGRSVDSVAS